MGNFIHFKLQQKAMTKFYKTQKKTPPSWTFFAHFGENRNFSRKSTFVTHMFLDFYCCTKFQKKVMNRFWEKLVIDVWIDRPTDKQQNKFKSI